MNRSLTRRRCATAGCVRPALSEDELCSECFAENTLLESFIANPLAACVRPVRRRDSATEEDVMDAATETEKRTLSHEWARLRDERTLVEEAKREHIRRETNSGVVLGLLWGVWVLAFVWLTQFGGSVLQAQARMGGR